MTKFRDLAFAWAGGVLFVASLAVCAASYLLTWSAPAQPDIRWTAAAIDVVLFSLFALHHSLFARDRIKRALASAVPERLLRSLYVWTAALLLIATCLLWRPVGGEIFHVRGMRVALHTLVQLLGVWLIARSVAGIDALELAGIRQARQVRLPPPRSPLQRASPKRSDGGTAEPTTHLQVGGVYRLVRHPLYLGWGLVVFGAAHMTGDRLVFAAVSVLYLAIAIPWEERGLAAAFGQEYERYRQQVRWRVVPFIY